MIKHIVTWSLNGADAEERAEQTADIAARLSPLVDLVDGLDYLELHRDLDELDGNSDLILVSQFQSREALYEYIDHPAHLDAVAHIKGYFSGRAAIDFEVLSH